VPLESVHQLRTRFRCCLISATAIKRNDRSWKKNRQMSYLNQVKTRIKEHLTPPRHRPPWSLTLSPNSHRKLTVPVVTAIQFTNWATKSWKRPIHHLLEKRKRVFNGNPKIALRISNTSRWTMSRMRRAWA
jgi:hypothetical protein